MQGKIFRNMYDLMRHLFVSKECAHEHGGQCCNSNELCVLMHEMYHAHLAGEHAKVGTLGAAIGECIASRHEIDIAREAREFAARIQYERDGNSSPNPGPDDQSRASRAVPGSEIGSTRDTEELEFTVEDPALFSEEEEEIPDAETTQLAGLKAAWGVVEHVVHAKTLGERQYIAVHQLRVLFNYLESGGTFKREWLDTVQGHIAVHGDLMGKTASEKALVFLASCIAFGESGGRVLVSSEELITPMASPWQSDKERLTMLSAGHVAPRMMIALIAFRRA